MAASVDPTTETTGSGSSGWGASRTSGLSADPPASAPSNAPRTRAQARVGAGGGASAAVLAEQVRPVSLAAEQLLPVPDALARLLPQPGLVRGAVAATEGSAALSLAVALAAEATEQGSWAVAVGLPSLGLAAASGLGLRLDRLAVVDSPVSESWATVVASLLEGFDVVLVGPPPSLGASMARRLAARLRERRSVLLLVDWPGRRWVERPDLVVAADTVDWVGIGQGWGCLRTRRVVARVAGRRGADRPRQGWLWMPGESGRIEVAEPPANDEGSSDVVAGGVGGRGGLRIVPGRSA